jgi:putative DNA primase/helicase
MSSTATTILDGVRLLARHGGIVEARILKTPKGTVSSYFDSPEAVAQAVVPWDGRASVYVTLNPVAPSLLARAVNRLEPYVRATTADADVLRRVWFPLDCDPVRPAGISANAAELAAALARRNEIVKSLGEMGFPDPVLAMSGNGAHALWAADLPNDEPTTRLIERALKSLRGRFSDGVVTVDEAVFNAGRVWKVYGTVAVKGDATADRPHRRATLEHMPAELVTLDRALLERLAAMAPREPHARHHERRRGPAFDLVGIFRERGLYVKPLRGQKHAVACPWKTEHSIDSGITESVLFEPESSGHPWGYKCQHDHCRRRTIKDVIAWLGLNPSPNGHHHAVPEEPWPEPQPVPDTLPPVPAFDPERLLPPALRPWVVDIAERSQAPIDYIAIAAIGAASSVVGRQIAIRPKQHDDWTVVPNLWGLGVGRAGLMKSPAMAEALKPLHRLVAQAREAHAGAMRDHHFRAEEFKAATEALRAKLREAAKAGRPTDDIRAAWEALEEPQAPKERRYIVNDATVEKLGELLKANRNGLMVFRDELAGWLSVMDREGHENDRAFYCEAWNGTGAYTYDRIERGTVVIEAACVAILGGIQPGPLAAYLKEIFADGHRDDGLIQRFQLLAWPDVAGAWQNVDRWPNKEARDRAWDVFRRLSELPREIGALVDDFGGLPFLRFSFEAQAKFDGWRQQTFEPMLRTESDESPVVLSHLAKYRSLVPSLALIFHLIDCVDGNARGPVTPEALNRALAWLPYLEAHARRCYHAVTARGVAATWALAQKITGGRLSSPFLPRTVLRCGWSGLTGPKDVFGAIDSLVDLHWLRREDVPATLRGGRPTLRYHINPRVMSVSSVDSSRRASAEDTREEEEEEGHYHVARGRTCTDSPVGIRKSTDETDTTGGEEDDLWSI